MFVLEIAWRKGLFSRSLGRLPSNCYHQEDNKEKKKKMQERRALHSQIDKRRFWWEKKNQEKKKKKRKRCFAEFIKIMRVFYEANEFKSDVWEKPRVWTGNQISVKGPLNPYFVKKATRIDKINRFNVQKDIFFFSLTVTWKLNRWKTSKTWVLKTYRNYNKK